MLDNFFQFDIPTFITGGVATFIAWSQLRKINKQLETNSLQVVLEIETQMNSRKLEFDRVAKDIRLLEADGTDDSKKQEKIIIMVDFFNTTKESYFNALDRLCFCILRGYLKDKEWKTEYRNLLKETIDTYTTDFNEASPYRNIKDLNNRWQRA